MSGMQEAAELITRARDEEWDVLVYGDYDADGVLRRNDNEPCAQGFRRQRAGIRARTLQRLRRHGKLARRHIRGLPASARDYGRLRHIQRRRGGIPQRERVRGDSHRPSRTARTSPRLHLHQTPNFRTAIPTTISAARVWRSKWRARSWARRPMRISISQPSPPLPTAFRSRRKPRHCGGGTQTHQRLAPQVLFKLPHALAGGSHGAHSRFHDSAQGKRCGQDGDASSALALFAETDEKSVFELSARLTAYNQERQLRCDELYGQAKAKLAAGGAYGRIIMLWDDSWNSGFVGIVAARLAEEYAGR